MALLPASTGSWRDNCICVTIVLARINRYFRILKDLFLHNHVFTETILTLKNTSAIFTLEMRERYKLLFKSDMIFLLICLEKEKIRFMESMRKI